MILKGTPMRRLTALAAVLAAPILLAGCGAPAAEEERHPSDELMTACLVLFGNLGADTAERRCDDAIALIEDDPESPEAVKVYDTLAELLED